ncbi:uncharacterized protein METZ01_LOCUS183816, partial [marine metagenome]
SGALVIRSDTVAEIRVSVQECIILQQKNWVSSFLSIPVPTAGFKKKKRDYMNLANACSWQVRKPIIDRLEKLLNA